VSVPVVLDVIVGPLREVRSYGRPSAHTYTIHACVKVAGRSITMNAAMDGSWMEQR
jgi:hypothetical protein